MALFLAMQAQCFLLHTFPREPKHSILVVGVWRWSDPTFVLGVILLHGQLARLSIPLWISQWEMPSQHSSLLKEKLDSSSLHLLFVDSFPCVKLSLLVSALTIPESLLSGLENNIKVMSLNSAKF